MGSSPSKNNVPTCKHCKDHKCRASAFSPASGASGDELLWMLPNNVYPPAGVEGWKSMKVCPQEDGAPGALNFRGTAGAGCVTANAMCCGGKHTQCMVSLTDQTKSSVGSITVPCGVQVKYSYDGTCDFEGTPTTTLVGTGVPKVLVPDKNTGTVYPYSYQVSLAPGYKCENGSVVVEETGKRPSCGNDPESFVSHGADETPAFELSKKNILVIVAVVGVLALVLVYFLTNRGPSDGLLTVEKIVQQAGVNEHLVIPDEVVAGATAKKPAAAAAKLAAAKKPVAGAIA